jgi:hypothetical protein
MSGPADVWAAFSHDPRLPENAALRAADADRDTVAQVLTEAYADGRLDRAEFDERTAATMAARTLGELPPLLGDLVHTGSLPAVRPAPGALTQPEIEEAAVAKWRSDRRSAVGGFVTASMICWVIWSVTMFGGFPWPVFVMLGTGMNALNTHLNREDTIVRERKRLEKKQRKELERRPPEEEQ